MGPKKWEIEFLFRTIENLKSGRKVILNKGLNCIKWMNIHKWTTNTGGQSCRGE